ncbi:MAG TPA: branched-chain amino acid ABC transporter permease [Stellaceae bacterium]|nr:branched-chain amino acid ABC transporter permease [Stellaceae bacterium]
MSADIALQLLFSGLSVGSVYALVALALVIPFKASGVLNFGQGEMVTLGAYIALALSLTTPLPYYAIVPLTLALAALVGVAFERLFIRPLVRAPEFTIVIGTFALGLMVKFAIRLYWQDNVYSLSVPFSTNPWIFGDVRINPVFVSIIACAVALVAALAFFFQRTRAGKAMRAVSQNQEAARLMGISVERVFSSTWALGTAIAALAGILFAPVTGIHPEIGNLILKAFVAAVIGGFDSLPGAVVGGLLLGLIETFSGAIVGSTFKNVIAFAVLILVLLVRPYGIFGSAGARRV